MNNIYEQLEAKVRERNADDFIEFVIQKFDGMLGAYLCEKQMHNDETSGFCPHCREEHSDEDLDADLLGD